MMQITENNNNTPRNLGSTHYATDVKYDFRAFLNDEGRREVGVVFQLVRGSLHPLEGV